MFKTTLGLGLLITCCIAPAAWAGAVTWDNPDTACVTVLDHALQSVIIPGERQCTTCEQGSSCWIPGSTCDVGDGRIGTCRLPSSVPQGSYCACYCVARTEVEPTPNGLP